jgi:ribonucleoside-triphosphate reductase
VPVDYPIAYVDKIRIEAPYHKLCNAGHISYVEFDSTPTGAQIERILRHAYSTTNINYMGINFHIRYCLDCASRAKKDKRARTNKIHKESLKTPVSRYTD